MNINMKRIKFRGRNIQGVWRHGDLLHNEDIFEYIRYLDVGRFYEEPVASLSIGQFTGLQDKDGVDIYEGDIVEIWDKTYDERSAGMVVFDRQGVRLVDSSMDEIAARFAEEIQDCCGDKTTFDDYINNTQDYECHIVGNIHDNPELLDVDPQKEKK